MVMSADAIVSAQVERLEGNDVVLRVLDVSKGSLLPNALRVEQLLVGPCESGRWGPYRVSERVFAFLARHPERAGVWRFMSAGGEGEMLIRRD
jgi:hypothetical protein